MKKFIDSPKEHEQKNDGHSEVDAFNYVKNILNLWTHCDERSIIIKLSIISTTSKNADQTINYTSMIEIYKQKYRLILVFNNQKYKGVIKTDEIWS